MVITRRIRGFEIGLHFRDGEFQSALGPGRHWKAGLPGRDRIEVVSRRELWFRHRLLDEIVKSGKLAEFATVIDLKDNQRALVWVDGRFRRMLPAGVHVYWNGVSDVQVEVIDVRDARFQHQELPVIIESLSSAESLDYYTVGRHTVGVLYQDGQLADTLKPGTYAFWRGVAQTKVVEVDMRETVADVNGQEIMTADKVTLRMNAVLTYRVTDAQKSVSATDDARQALYRETQLAVRAVVGARSLDQFLSDKDAVSEEVLQSVQQRAQELGLHVTSVGVRDVMLPGDMKELMNKVTEAKKAAEANLIVRREETAAMRSQANTAKLLADNPTLMRLRELEVLEKVATNGTLNVMLGEKGLAQRVVNLL